MGGGQERIQRGGEGTREEGGGGINGMRKGHGGGLEGRVKKQMESV